MGAALGNQYLVAVLQPVNGSRAPNRFLQQSLFPGHEDGKGGQRNLHGHLSRYGSKHLAVGNHHSGLLLELAQGIGQPVLFHADCLAVGVQNVPEYLLLGQNQPSLRRRLVDGNHQYRQLPQGDQIPHQLELGIFGVPQMGNFLFEGEDIFPGARTDPDGLRGTFRVFSQQIRLVPRHHIGDIFLPEQLHQLSVTFLHPCSAVYHQHRHIGSVQHLAGPLHALFSQRALVVKAGGVDNGHRPHGQKLHCFAHRVGGGAPGFGYHRQLLARYGIDNAGLARIPSAKETNMDAISGWCVIETHGTSS